MASKKPGIPSIPTNTEVYSTLQALKENIELITGVRGGSPVAALPAGATLADVVSKINEIVGKLNYSGE